MWVGLNSTKDEAGTAAYKVVELDDHFNRQAVLFRDVQGYECDSFLKLFDHIKILEGGIESGFKKVPVEEYQPRLLHIKGKLQFRVRQVPLKCSSLNSNDVFILDAGLSIYVWNGKTANSFEKFKAVSVAEEIRADRKGQAKVTKLAEGDDDNEAFWKLLGGKETINSEAEIKDDQISGDKRFMYRLSDESGTLKMTEVTYGKGSLNTNDVYIVDNGNEIIVWVGKGATDNEKISALRYAEQYLKDFNRPVYLSICIVREGMESPQFWSSFK